MVDDADTRRLRFSFDEPGRARLDHFLADEEDLPVTRSQLKKLCDKGQVRVNGDVVKAGHRLTTGDLVEVDLPPPAPIEAEPQAMDLDILFEDADIVVVNKPKGLTVHPAPGHPDGTLVNGLLHHCKDLSGIGGALRPGIVHRLDKDTTGVMVVAKSDPAHLELSRMFHDKDLTREYLALVRVAPHASEGTFDTWYGRHPVQRKKFSSKGTSGKRAVTEYKVEERFAKGAAVRCRLRTGRTHQIRVHFADAGSPLFGDPLYARKPGDEPLKGWVEELGRQALHAEVLGFRHPVTGEELLFRAPLPRDLSEFVERLRGWSG